MKTREVDERFKMQLKCFTSENELQNFHFISKNVLQKPVMNKAQTVFFN